MARSLNKLTARKVATAKAGRHSDGGGLYLVVSDGGAGKWVFRYTLSSKTTDLGLGSKRDVPLADARQRASDYRAMVAKGENPKAEHQREVVPTFAVFVERYLEAMSVQWRNEKHRNQWRTTLLKDAAAIGGKPINEISTDDVLAVLQPLWQTKPETAARLRGRIENVLDAATARRMRTGENPARWRGHLKNLLPKRPRLSRGHLAAMPFDEAPAFVAKLRERPATAARALEFTILTAARSGEAIGARWQEVDTKGLVWVVPAERTKAGKAHRVPLSPRAMAIVNEMAALKHAPTDFVFPAAKKGMPLSSMAMLALLRRMDVDVTVHGFRSAFRDWCGERTHFPREVAEAALAHVLSDKVEAAYRRGDALEKRRRLMEAWASFLETPRRGNVIPLTKSG